MTVSVSIEDDGASDAASTRAGHSEVMQLGKKKDNYNHDSLIRWKSKRDSPGAD